MRSSLKYLLLWIGYLVFFSFAHIHTEKEVRDEQLSQIDRWHQGEDHSISPFERSR